MTKSAFTNLDRATENEWSDVLPDAPAAGLYPSATTRTSGLRPAIMQPPSSSSSPRAGTSVPSDRFPLPSRLPAIHPADEPNDRTIQRVVSVAELDFEDADRTKEITADQVSRLASTSLPSEIPPALPQRPTLPVPANNAALPAQAFPSLSDLAGGHPVSFPQAGARAHATPSAPRYGSVAPQLHALPRPMPWMATPPLPRNERRLATVLVVIGAFVVTAAVVLGTALFILQK